MNKLRISAFLLLSLAAVGCKKADNTAAAKPCENFGEYPAIGELHMAKPGPSWKPVEQPFCTALTNAYRAVGYRDAAAGMTLTVYHRPDSVSDSYTARGYAEELRKAFLERDYNPLELEIGHCSEVQDAQEDAEEAAAFYCRTAIDEKGEFEAGSFVFVRDSRIPGLLQSEATAERGTAERMAKLLEQQVAELMTVTATNTPQ